MANDCVHGLLLFVAQHAMKGYIDWLTAEALVPLILSASSSATKSTKHPRGSARCLPRSSPQPMTRGLSKVDNRMACAL